MFERLGVDAALAGDLLEERGSGRSRFWYCRQVLAAMWLGIWGAIWGHKLLALRALAVGCAMNAVWVVLWQRFLHIGVAVRSTAWSKEEVESLLLILFTQVVTGWVVARTHRAHAIPMVFVFATWLVPWYVPAIDFSYLQMLAVDSLDQPRFRAYLVRYVWWTLLPLCLEVVGLFSGGVIASGLTFSPAPGGRTSRHRWAR
jgi:hypothetical protein